MSGLNTKACTTRQQLTGVINSGGSHKDQAEK